MPNISEKAEWFTYESPRFFLFQQSIFRLHILNSHDTMLFNKQNIKTITSGNMVKKYDLRRTGDQMKAPGNSAIQLFENQKIRVAWDAEREEWYFSIVDVVGVLTDSPDYNTGRKYWNKLKQRLKEEGSELVTNCHQLKMRAWLPEWTEHAEKTANGK